MAEKAIAPKLGATAGVVAAMTTSPPVATTGTVERGGTLNVGNGGDVALANGTGDGIDDKVVAVAMDIWIEVDDDIGTAIAAVVADGVNWAVASTLIRNGVDEDPISTVKLDGAESCVTTALNAELPTPGVAENCGATAVSAAVVKCA
ncbi:MAG: hypothetical protein ACP5R2_13080 [Anaerolineae bacterium]